MASKITKAYKKARNFIFILFTSPGYTFRFIISGQLSLIKKKLFNRLGKNEINHIFKSNENPIDFERASYNVDIVICVHNAPKDVEQCLNSVLQKTSEPFNIIIVDDGSGDETKNILNHYVSNTPDKIKLIRNEMALGYTYAANIGLKNSSGDYVVLLNSDTIVSKLWLDKMLRCAISDSKIGVVGPMSNTASWQSIPLISEDGDWARNFLPEDITVDEWAEALNDRSAIRYPKVSFLNGFCYMISRVAINEVGIFDELNFGKGYGEENDYSCRLKLAGYKLAVCDNAYVYHTQSKSYTNERRKLLSDAAGITLTKKYGINFIEKNVDDCKNNIILKNLRSRASNMNEYVRVKKEITKKFKEKKILFFLPVDSIGGGANVVLSEALTMENLGISVTIGNFNRHKSDFIKNYPDWKEKTKFYNSKIEFQSDAHNYDAIVATGNVSVEWLSGIENTTLGYYVQDYEPLFYNPSSKEFSSAKNSYELIPQIKMFTKTQWNANQIFEHHHKSITVIGASFDEKTFGPFDDEYNGDRQVIRIIAMVRPSTPRRSPELTMRVLKYIQKKYAKKVDIIIFGVNPNDPALFRLDQDFDFINMGILTPEKTAVLFGHSDIFVDFSEYQAMGLTGMEAMASGCAVVLPINGGASSFAKDNENSLLVNTTNETDCKNVIEKLIEDKKYKKNLIENGMHDMHNYSNVFSVYKILNTLFS